MTKLSIEATKAIDKWAEKFNPAAGQALIDAAARSPYLSSQFNKFVGNGGQFEAPKGSAASAGVENGKTVINVGQQLASDYLSTPLKQDQLATVFAHEMGHALSPGGMTAGTVIPTQAVQSSHRAEGVALTSEMIVSYQLGLGENGKYSYSDSGVLKQTASGSIAETPGALAQQFKGEIALHDAAYLWTLESKDAQSLVNHEVSPLAQTYGVWSGKLEPSVAPKLTYDFGSSGSSSADYESTSTTTNAAGQVTKTVHTEVSHNDLGQQTRVETVTDASGTNQTIYNQAGDIVETVRAYLGADNVKHAIDSATSFLSLVKALQDGKPLPIAVAGVNTLATIQAGNGGASITLTGTQSVLGAASSLYSLQTAWSQGDVPGVFAAGASTLTYGATAYANVLGYSSVKAAAHAGAISAGAGNAVGGLQATEHQFNSNKLNTELRKKAKMIQKQATNDTHWARAA